MIAPIACLIYPSLTNPNWNDAACCARTSPVFRGHFGNCPDVGHTDFRRRGEGACGANNRPNGQLWEIHFGETTAPPLKNVTVSQILTDRTRQRYVLSYMCVNVCMYIYIYSIYVREVNINIYCPRGSMLLSHSLCAQGAVLMVWPKLHQ